LKGVDEKMKCQNLQTILSELEQSADFVSEEEIEVFAQAIVKADRVFVAGAGRSGFAANGFANRLMHLGFAVYTPGAPTTPPIGKGDLLVIGSGSGRTAGLVNMANKAQAVGADIATVTIDPGQTIGSMAQAVIKLPGSTRLLGEGSEVQTVQPVGTLFEQLSWLVYDSIVMTLKEMTHQSFDDLISRHGNLE